MRNKNQFISDSLKWNWGIKLFVAHADIRISEDWSAEIKNALSSCDAGIAFLTDREAFKASTWCDQEIGWMLGRFEDKVLAMRFKLNGVYQDPYGPLGGRQAQPVAENESEDQIAAKIVDWCMTRESLRNKLCTSLVKAFAKARNWYQRDDIYQRLKTFHTLNELQVQLLLEGMHNNLQTWGGEDRTTPEHPEMLDSLLGFIVAQPGFKSESPRRNGTYTNSIICPAQIIGASPLICSRISQSVWGCRIRREERPQARREL